MAKLKNKKTGVIKEIEQEFISSMYLATGEWELIEEKKSEIKEEKKEPVFKAGEINNK